MLDVGATSKVSLSGAMPHSSAISVQMVSGGSLRVSRTPTQTSDRSQLPISLNSFSRQADARMGPEPMAKNFSPLSSQPAYCDAMQAAKGDLVATDTSCDAGEPGLAGEMNTSPWPDRQISASRRPASKLPVVLMPQSMMRVPQNRVLTATPSDSAASAMILQSSNARWFSVGIAQL